MATNPKRHRSSIRRHRPHRRPVRYWAEIQRSIERCCTINRTRAVRWRCRTLAATDQHNYEGWHIMANHRHLIIILWCMTRGMASFYFDFWLFFSIDHFSQVFLKVSDVFWFLFFCTFHLITKSAQTEFLFLHFPFVSSLASFCCCCLSFQTFLYSYTIYVWELREMIESGSTQREHKN